MNVLESLNRQARLFTQLGYPKEGVMVVLALEDGVDADAVVFGQKPTRQHWTAYQRLIEERFRR